MNIYKKAIRDGAPDGAGKARKMGCTSVQKNKKKARKTGLLAPPVRFERTTPWINNSASLRRAFPCGSSKPHLLRKTGKSLSYEKRDAIASLFSLAPPVRLERTTP